MSRRHPHRIYNDDLPGPKDPPRTEYVALNVVCPSCGTRLAQFGQYTHKPSEQGETWFDDSLSPAEHLVDDFHGPEEKQVVVCHRRGCRGEVQLRATKIDEALAVLWRLHRHAEHDLSV